MTLLGMGAYQQTALTGKEIAKAVKKNMNQLHKAYVYIYSIFLNALYTSVEV